MICQQITYIISMLCTTPLFFKGCAWGIYFQKKNQRFFSFLFSMFNIQKFKFYDGKTKKTISYYN